MKRILIINGHPDAGHPHFCDALADAYADGAEAAGHSVRRLAPGSLDFPMLTSQQEWEHGSLPPVLQSAQDTIGWAQHLVLIFPLWLGDMPALLKGFLEQVARPGFAFGEQGKNPFGRKGLSGRSAHVVVTMGMPALVYRWYFRAHSVKSLERNILKFVGIDPVQRTLIGSVAALSPAEAAHWLEKMRALGRQAR